MLLGARPIEDRTTPLRPIFGGQRKPGHEPNPEDHYESHKIIRAEPGALHYAAL
jgi:hypothetical protein